MNHTISLLLFASLISVTSWASDFESPRTAALGGAGHAAPLLNDSIYLNPSFQSFLPSYSVSGNYEEYHGGATEPDGSSYLHGHVSNVSVEDGRSETVEAGVGLTLRDYGKILNIGAAHSFVKQMGFGLGAKITFPNDPNQQSAHDLTFSTSLAATDWFDAAAIVDNIVDSSGAQAQGLYREYILGTKFNIQKIALIYIDPHLASNVAPGTSFGYEAGAELTVMQDLFVRGGYFRNSNVPEIQNTRGNGYGFGLGWISPRFSLDYALKHVLTPVINVQNCFGFTLYI
jgi:hypothetical protein